MSISHAEKWEAKPTKVRGRRKRVRPESGEQLSLGEVTGWGGRRKGAGRKKGLRPKVHHLARPEHGRWRPLHVTLRRALGLPSLRHEVLHQLIKRAIADTRREGF